MLPIGFTNLWLRRWYEYSMYFLQDMDVKMHTMVKILCLHWLMIVDQLNTTNMLRCRNLNVHSTFTCVLCKNTVEEGRDHHVLNLV